MVVEESEPPPAAGDVEVCSMPFLLVVAMSLVFVLVAVTAGVFLVHIDSIGDRYSTFPRLFDNYERPLPAPPLFSPMKVVMFVGPGSDPKVSIASMVAADLGFTYIEMADELDTLRDAAISLTADVGVIINADYRDEIRSAALWAETTGWVVDFDADLLTVWIHPVGDTALIDPDIFHLEACGDDAVGVDVVADRVACWVRTQRLIPIEPDGELAAA
jgi:hypothetical protein